MCTSTTIVYIVTIKSPPPCHRVMKLLGALLLCAAVLTGTTGLPTTDWNRKHAAMRAYEAALQEAFDFEENTGDGETAIQEAEEPFEGYTADEDIDRDMDAMISGLSCPSKWCNYGGKCTLGFFKYTCKCSSGYIGKRCEIANKTLLVTAKNGVNLPNTDIPAYRVSDPYIRFTATNHDGSTTTKTTSTERDTIDPNWDDKIDFGINTWKSLTVQVFDSDIGQDDALSSPQTFSISKGSHMSIKHCADDDCKGYVTFDYDFE